MILVSLRPTLDDVLIGTQDTLDDVSIGTQESASPEIDLLLQNKSV